MKAKITFKARGQVKILLEDGRRYSLPPDVAKAFHPALEWGDDGIIVFDSSRNRWRFIPEATEVLPILTPDQVHNLSEKLPK